MRHPVSRLLYRVMRWMYDTSLLEICEGIRLCDVTSTNDEQREAFRASVLEALALVKTHDPHRFQRLQRRLDYVVNCQCLGAAEYNPGLQACELDFARFRFEEDEEWCRLMLACALVHEATHGLVEARGVPYDRERYLRIERLCQREEVRFTRRVRPDAEFEEFDETWSRERFEARLWKSMVSYIRRLREAELPRA